MIIKAKTVSAFFLWLICALPVIFTVIILYGMMPWLTKAVLYVLAVFLLILLFYLCFLVKNTYCKISSDHIRSYTGVFFRNMSCVNTKKVLYYTVCKSPFSRITGLNFIIINTFGGRTVLLFLSEQDARLITEIL